MLLGELSTAFIDNVIGKTETVLFVLRIILSPILDYAVLHWLRKPYLELLHTIGRG